jgi:hypothetical protein
MADKRIVDLDEATSITGDKFMVLDSVADDTEKATLEDAFEALQTLFGAYGAIYTTSGVATQALTAATPAKLTLFDTDGLSNAITVSAANDQMTINTAGVYEILANFSMTSSINNVIVSFYTAVDGVRQEPGISRKIGTGADVGACGFGPVLLNLAATEVLTVEVEATLNTNLTIIDAAFSAFRVG